MKTTINKKEASEVEIEGVLESALFEQYESKALAKIGERMELPGFRKGKAPADMVKKNANDMMILEEMAELALNEAYPKILEENKIDAIGRPQISITKIARGSDLEFKILTAVLPEVKLPDYKKIAGNYNSKEEFKKEVAVDDAQVEKTILDLRKMRAEQALPKHEHEDSDAEAHAHEEIKESDYPPFDDEFAKSFGDFTAETLKEKIRGNLKMEKETEQKDKLRVSMVEELLKETKTEIPEILIESEIDKILYKLQADIANMGFKFEDYLKQINKTVEDLRKDWRADAEKRAKLQLTINAISEKENIKPTEEEIQREVDNILKMYKEADPARARAYVENMLGNEKVFQFLEQQ